MANEEDRQKVNAETRQFSKMWNVWFEFDRLLLLLCVCVCNLLLVQRASGAATSLNGFAMIQRKTCANSKMSFRVSRNLTQGRENNES